MTDLIARLRAEVRQRQHESGDMLYLGAPDPLLTEAADELSALRERVEALERALATIQALIGNVDHSRGHGPCAAEMRGGMLNDIRDIASAILAQQGGEVGTDIGGGRG